MTNAVSVNRLRKIEMSQINGVDVFTFTLWIIFLAIGIIGLTIPYDHPSPLPPAATTTQAELINVKLAAVPIEEPEVLPIKSTMAQPPVAPTESTPKPVPPLVAVAQPNPKIAFALPVEGPVKIVEAAGASYARQTEVPAPAPAPTPPVQTLTYGQGEGIQPQPDYPARARREGQEGTVVVQFVVGKDGTVLSAETAQSCPWKLLNDSAVHSVRERWHFSSGAIRTYQVAIRFELTK